MVFFFTKKLTRPERFQRVGGATAFGLEFKRGGGALKTASVALCRFTRTGTSKEVLFMVAVAVVQGQLRFVTAGSKVPGRAGFGVK